MKLCIDTNAYSAFLEINNNVAPLLEQVETILLSTIVLGELYAGFLIGSRYEANCSLLKKFISRAGVSVVDISEDIAERYGEIVAQLKKQGAPIPTNDIWIAATALETGARLVSYDDHFQHVPGLIVLSP
jgi:tRNA(fMet)-specific endonuclease VapC